MKQTGNPAPPRLLRGQASIEYIVVVIAVVVILITKPDVVTDIVNALKDAYAAFVYAMSASDIPLS